MKEEGGKIRKMGRRIFGMEAETEFRERTKQAEAHPIHMIGELEAALRQPVDDSLASPGEPGL